MIMYTHTETFSTTYILYVEGKRIYKIYKDEIGANLQNIVLDL